MVHYVSPYVFSSLIRPTRAAIMTVLRGYFDNSKSGDAVAKEWSSVGGMMGTLECWEKLHESWIRDILNYFSIPYFHMKEFTVSAKHSPFEGWDKRPSKRTDCLKAINHTIFESGLRVAWVVISLSDLLDVTAAFGISIDAYSLGIACLKSHASDHFNGEPVEFVVDNFKGCSKGLGWADAYLEHHPKYKNVPGYVTAVPSNVLSKYVPALQAADYIAWESRRYWDTHYEKDVLSSKRQGQQGIVFSPRESFGMLLDPLQDPRRYWMCWLESAALTGLCRSCADSIRVDFPLVP